jgi:signal transduction histidine kinase
MKRTFYFKYQSKLILQSEQEIKLLRNIVNQQRDFNSKLVHECKVHSQFIFVGLDILMQVDYTPENKSEYEKLVYAIKESTLIFKTLLSNFSEHIHSEYGKKTNFKKETLSINEYIHTIIKDLQFYLSTSGQPIAAHLATPSFTVLLDAIKFQQVVRTLILNARQHGSEGSINLAVAKDPSGDTWTLTITNSYNPTGNKQEDNPGLGLGFGLFISKQLIESMGGELEIHRTDHLFKVTLCMKDALG